MGSHEVMSITKAPAVVVLDAINRAVRTWWGVSGAVLLVTFGGLGLNLMNGGDPLAPEFWQGLFRGMVTALLASVFSYLGRFKAPPPAELTPAPVSPEQVFHVKQNE